ncbi:probable homogentisate phytyltransferase 1, chloroplastic isoform X1 [Zingiber officinale]|uniref:probable homogentisate phytyltransferase 1, chloroplastic isoform X1 n=1 Tax=Zingiber officinale TaxID=94328 RepID=UPI001C4CB990|nr:probable homogentisate phytyltransferase 1, chloroplastic isoform X1 [Zingiber officinale]
MDTRCAIYRSQDKRILGSESPWICLFFRSSLPLLLLASLFLLTDQVRPQEAFDSLESLQERGFFVLKTYQSPVRRSVQGFTWDSSNHQLNHNRRNFASKRTNDLIHANATSGHPLGSQPEAHNRLKLALSAIDAFYRFSRPHTVIGTAMSIVSVSLLSVESLSDLSPLFLTGLLEAVVAALFMNIYIVGLNQVFDIEIDKVNKPSLPLASGEYSPRTGITIILSFAALSFGVAWFVGSWPLFWALFVSFILGTAYSINLPLLRWKRFAVVAALCILAVRAVIVQVAFFLHMQTFVFRRSAILSRPLIFATAFMTFFSVVIALFKDIPDLEGDRIFGIRSYTVRLGQQRVFWICVYLLQVAYSVAIMIGATSSCLWSKIITILGHAVLALILWSRANSLDLTSKAAITSFYMFIWKLFYAEYLLIPLVR